MAEILAKIVLGVEVGLTAASHYAAPAFLYTTLPEKSGFLFMKMAELIKKAYTRFYIALAQKQRT